MFFHIRYCHIISTEASADVRPALMRPAPSAPAPKNTLAACKCVSHSSAQRKPHATCKQDVVSNLITYLSLDICAAIGNNFRLHAPPTPCTHADMHVRTHFFFFFSSRPSLPPSNAAPCKLVAGRARGSSSGLCRQEKGHAGDAETAITLPNGTITPT